MNKRTSATALAVGNHTLRTSDYFASRAFLDKPLSPTLAPVPARLAVPLGNLPTFASMAASATRGAAQ